MKREEGPGERTGAGGEAVNGRSRHAIPPHGRTPHGRTPHGRTPHGRSWHEGRGSGGSGGSGPAYARGARGAADGWRARLRGFGAPAAVAASGLAVVLAVFVSTLVPYCGAHHGGDGTARKGTGAAARPPARPHGSRPASIDAATPKPEKCEDGSNPAASLRPSGASGPAVDRIVERGRLIVGVDQNSYLWGYRDPNSRKIAGFDIDLVHAIAKDLLGPHAKITYKTIPTDQRVSAVRGGHVDMVVRTMTVNCERAGKVAFSTAYFQAGQQLVVPRDHARVTGFNASMRGRRLCYAAGSTAGTLMSEEKYKRLGAKSLVVPNQLDCLVRMQLGEADATLTDSALGAGQAAQDPTVHLIGHPVTAESYGVAMKRTDKDLVRRVNEVLKEYTAGGADSQWRTSYDRWLGDHIMGTDGGKDMKPPKPAYRN
jgi:polar amino acid transport system substrate-binding protein